ncbi:MAG: hypothetical protein EXR17_02260 [Flavobacteriaceae bacterium]|nr:hypothetical protein [Flavobacteriaceae bacterium]
MIKPLSYSDLLLYYFGEADLQTTKYINKHISEYKDWSEYLNTIHETTLAMNTLSVLPESTTLSIILEESDSKLYLPI